MAYNVAYQSWFVRGYGFNDNPADNTQEAVPLSKYLWLFFFSKPLEFMDTFIMVCKMNFRQVSFLHVYHHTSVFCFWWFVVFMAPMGEAYLSAVLNSAVHVVMYSYYLFMSMGVLKSLMSHVKPFITRGQMFQFVILMTQSFSDIYLYFTRTTPKKNVYPITLTIALFVYMWTMLGLFANFYLRAYIATPPTSPAIIDDRKKKIK